jgi:hypothetical protein
MKLFTKAQEKIVTEFTRDYDIKPDQISFDRDSDEPIFDYAALNTLRWALTDISETRPTICFFNERAGIVTVSCEITRNGTKCSDLGSAKIGDRLPDGETVNNMTQCQNLAIARAFRRALRCAGIDLVEAHRNRTNRSKRESQERIPLTRSERIRNQQKEIHALATEVKLIRGSDRQDYEDLIGRLFQGRASTKT